MYYGIKNPHGGDIYESNVRLDFSANVNPCGMPRGAARAAAAALKDADRYPDPFCRELVREIAQKQSLPEEDIFIGNGASELIYAFCMAERPQRTVVAVPAFVEYAQALKHAGSEVIYYYMKKENGFAPDEGLISFLQQVKPDALFLCNPNNPTGRPVDDVLLKRILETTRAEGIRFFLDECFCELSDRQVSLKNELASFGNLFILRAFTKCYGMAGLRLGYCFCADHQLLARMSEFTPPWSVSHPAQMAGIAALREDKFLQESRMKIKEAREELKQQMEDLGLKVYPSETNFLFFEGPSDLPERLKKDSILIRDCSNYEGLGKGYYRIAVRKKEENTQLIRSLKIHTADQQ